MRLAPTALREQDRLRWHASGAWGTASLAAGFAATAARQPAAEALVDAATRLSFAEWDRRAAALAAGLRQLGVGAGDVVAYQLPNWWEAAVVFLAALRLGAVVNPVLPIFRAHELRFILAQSGAAALVIPGEFRGCDYRALIAPLRDALPALRHVLVARDAAPAGMVPFAPLLATPPGELPAVDADALAMLMYTSGTTAEPKGVLHTHNTLRAEVASLARIHALTAADRTLMPSPLTHISGVIHAICTPALLGTSAVLMERWEPGAALGLIARERVTYMVGAPTFLQELADHRDRAAHDLASLRLFSCGGAAVSPDLIRRARAALGCVAKRVYGATEFPTITTTDAADAETMGIETEGRVIAPAELRIVDPDGAALPPGAEGEVQARGPDCCVGYADPALNIDAFTLDGWFRTGDLGSVDTDGYLRISGRLKDIVIRKGEKFSVRELEEAIARHPAVAAAAVIALPDPASGERACAVVTLRPGAALTLPELSTFLLAAGLARQKLPEQLEVVAALPHTDSGKLHRAALRARFAG
ncbi:MAG: AMP-binding protein [Deltaproteobacteria bacterium]|nr:AMP-binding protein [Deltaproteobacteria bacterium]